MSAQERDRVPSEFALRVQAEAAYKAQLTPTSITDILSPAEAWVQGWIAAASRPVPAVGEVEAATEDVIERAAEVLYEDERNAAPPDDDSYPPFADLPPASRAVWLQWGHSLAAAGLLAGGVPERSEAVVVVPCDTETYPRAFNDGFDTALEQVIEELTEGQYCDPDDDALHAAILRDYGMHLRQMVDQAHESAGRKPGRSGAETEWGVRVEHEGGVIQSPLDFDVPNTFESAQKACDEANAHGANAVPIRREVGPWTAAGDTTEAGDDE